jgi:hypothetical protein
MPFHRTETGLWRFAHVPEGEEGGQRLKPVSAEIRAKDSRGCDLRRKAKLLRLYHNSLALYAGHRQLAT